MRQETYRIAYDEAFTELNEILKQFDELRLRKDQIEKVVDALRPFQDILEAETSVAESEPDYAVSEPAEQESEPAAFSFLQVSAPATEPDHVAIEMTSERMEISEELSLEPVAYFRNPSSDPFQRRIDDALWGWQQRPEGLLSPI